MKFNIDYILKLPLKYKIVGLSFFLLIIILIYVYSFYMPELRIFSEKRAQYNKIYGKYLEDKKMADNVHKYREELKSINDQFQLAMAKLPNEKEIPKLLIDISNLGKEAGLDFKLFQPKSDVPKGFYAEVPIDIKVVGNFHEIVSFFDKIGHLSRIVNISDISLSDPKKDKDRVVLNASFTANTYRFIKEEAKK